MLDILHENVPPEVFYYTVGHDTHSFTLMLRWPVGPKITLHFACLHVSIIVCQHLSRAQ